MKKRAIIKSIVSTSTAMLLVSGCVQPQPANPNQPNTNSTGGLSKTQIGAIAGAVLGAAVGGATDTKKTHRARRMAVGAAAGAAIGAAIGYSLEQQAQEVAQVLNTNVDNNPEAEKNPDKDLVVSNTDKFVKIMFRSPMMFVTNSITPTPSARAEIQRMIPVFKKYPNMIIQTVGHTDNRGSYEYNQRLSEGRALSVANILRNNGITNPIYSKGCSYLKPLVPNTNPTNWALNRRVEVYLYPNEDAVIDPCSN
jgi:outer membrane protein OmpA-like peptidoglycan-associated protein